MPSPEVSKGPTPTISLEKLNQELTSPVAGDRPQGDAATYAFNGDTAANNGYIAATNLQVPVRMLLLLLCVRARSVLAQACNSSKDAERYNTPRRMLHCWKSEEGDCITGRGAYSDI